MGYFRAIHTASRLEDKNPSSEQVYNLSLQLSQRPMNGNALMQYTLYNSNGAAAPISKLTKLGITDRYGVSTRDLRVFDLPSSGFPYILVRESTILIHLFDLRLLVQHDQVLFFHIAECMNPGHDHGNSHGPQNNTDGNDHRVSRVFSHNLEAKLRGGHGLGLSVSQPYELRVVEAALASVSSVLEAEYMLIEQQLSNALQKSDLDTLDKEENVIHSKLRIILDLTRKLATIEKRARQVRDVVQEVLNEDEDMVNMYLSDKRAGKPHALEDHQDVEYLFEAYFKASDSVVQEAVSLMDNIRRTEETIQSTLSVRRNQIMVLEAKIEILMLALAWATLVAGWYGMNVINYSEESAHAFAVVVSLSVTGILSASWYGMRKLRRINKLRL
ncbi:CorA family magnesium transporter [Aspergillus glaucus CBS 516.65]|uniref:Magnesium transporter n=1 Tax=Aspergillus glaucus CBS 516.65 TaxID=1160497 RepID=A0A1L9VXK4_ASPGL|nr:hypothetical protein ASPGLDRAFT_116635 [Aspergillus glaucus CBS 516.65]OJJ88641.1 hypothetical protein ASPGLDRAFT_116635 [Aspergillus glaucus CBS 516.65]